MKRIVLSSLASSVAAGIVVCGCWIGGMEFDRGPALGGCYVAAVVLAVYVFVATMFFPGRQ